jgi:hypothetical protein
MSLFDEASLIVTPNAYKEGKIYAIKPTDGSGDLSVVRATSATRVDANGLVEIPRTNLLLRSEEFDNEIWLKQFSGTGLIPSVINNAVISPDGTFNADTIVFNRGIGNSISDLSIINQNINISTIGFYTFSVFVKATSISDVGKQIFLRTSNGSLLIAFTLTENWKRIETSANISITGLNNIQIGNRGVITSGNSVSIDIWGAQLEQGVSATEYIPTVASIRTKFAGITQDGGSASNIPRLDYTNSTCPSILVEPQRTNLALRSEEFDNAAWSRIALESIVSNTEISPNGTLTAEKIIPNTTNTNHYVQINATVVIGQAYTFSFFAKKGEYNFTSSFISGLGITANWDLQNGIASAGASIVDFGNGWYRCIVSGVAISTTASLRIYAQNSTLSVLAGDGTSGIFIWGAQLEAGSNATSYIPTVASAVTRNADVISKTGISDLINSVQGSLFLEYKALLPINSLGTGISLSNGTNSQLIYVSNTTTTNRIIVSVVNSNGANFNFNVDGINYNNKIKIICKWIQGSFKIFYNGNLIINNTTFNTFNANALNEFSFRRGDGQRAFEGNFEKGIIFPLAISDQECIALTTL